MYKATTKWLVTVGTLLAVMTACGDLTVQPKSSITTGNVFSDTTSYRAFLAKLYAGLVVTGQNGPDNNPDILGIDEGFSQYTRGYWQMQELPTDEAIIAWGDIGLPELNTMTWSASNVFVNAMYSRIFYQVAVANQFLRETRDTTLTRRGVSTELRTQIQQYRAEARFLRALSYWHALDLFGSVPLVDEDVILTTLPRQGTRTEVFTFVESELKAIRSALPAKSTGANYARASQASVDMLLAKLYLNAKVYTGTDRSSDARLATEAVINAGFTLDPDFLHLFSADNNTSAELIFTVPQDGDHTRTWGGLTYLVHAGVGGNMKPSDFGIDGGWWGLRLRPETVDRLGGPRGPDRRSWIIFDSGQTKSISDFFQFGQGYGYPKYRNVKSTGGGGSNLTFPDTDFPMFRLADAYLMYAEAVLRGGGGSRATALGYVNQIRERAYGGVAGDITDAELTLQFILDERSRELLWEGHRRQDLIRFGQFSDAGIWEWKGNVKAGRTTAKFYDLYPIPANELSANPTVKQNPGY